MLAPRQMRVDAQNGHAYVLMRNRHLDADGELVLEWRDPAPARVLACEALTAESQGNGDSTI